MSKLLVGAGADPDRVNPHTSCTELICAAESGRVLMVQLLIDIGADVNKADETYAMTPLNWAVQGGHTHVVRILLEAGADPNVADNFGVTPLIPAAERCPQYVVRQLVDAGRRFNRKKIGLSFGLKNGLRFNFHSETCLNYPFLNIFFV